MQGEWLLLIHWGGDLLALWAAGRLLGLCTGPRLFFAAGWGAAGALLLGGLGGLILWPLAMVGWAWPRLPRQKLVRAWGTTLLAGVLLGGLCGALWQQGISPLWALALGSLGLLLAGALLRLPLGGGCRRIRIRLGGRALTLSAMVDTGNLLRDGITGLPVIVCSRRVLSPLGAFHLSQGEALPGFRLMSVRTCAGRGLMLVFRPDEVALESRGRWQPCQALVGVAPAPYEGGQALVPAALIS